MKVERLFILFFFARQPRHSQVNGNRPFPEFPFHAKKIPIKKTTPFMRPYSQMSKITHKLSLAVNNA